VGEGIVSADLLRKAAEILRERAKAATQGEWKADGAEVHALFRGLGYYLAVIEDDETRPVDAAYIATMHPAVGLALADWLDDEAGRCDLAREHAEDARTYDAAERIARLIVGGAS
jgi:hypothetical protein